MNPGVTEEASKAVQSVTEALKSTPVVLALVIFNVIFMALTAWTNLKQSETYDHGAQRWKDLVEIAMKQCVPVSMKLQSDDTKPVELPPQP